MNSYDLDGVIFVEGEVLLRPTESDIIVTGRSIDEKEYTLKWLRENNINNEVIFNNIPFNEKTREKSGQHKANILNMRKVKYHFEDDEIQAIIIEQLVPSVKVIRVVHDLTDKENRWYGTIPRT